MGEAFMRAPLILYIMHDSGTNELLAYQPGDVTHDAQHKWVHIRSSKDASEKFWVRARCRRYDCIHCEMSKVNRLARRLAAWAVGPQEPGTRYRLFTFSEKNLLLLVSAVSSLETSWRAFLHTVHRVRGHPWHLVERWARWIEVTEGDNGFNAHLHVIVGTRKRVDWKALHTRWDRATGSKSMFHSTGLMDPEIAARYAASYAKKDSGKFWGGLRQRSMTRYGRGLKGKIRVSWSHGTAPQVPSGDGFYCCGNGDLFKRSDLKYEGHCGGEGSDPPQPTERDGQP